MSGLLMGLAFELPITDDFGRPEKFILLAYADHADQNGKNIFPSIDLISSKTGYEERSVQQITHKLENLGYLISDGKGIHGTNRWTIPLERTEGGAKIAPRKNCALLENAPEGFAPEGNAPKPLVKDLLVVVTPGFGEICTLYEHEIGALTTMIADAIGDAVDTYPVDWIPEAIGIAAEGNHRSWSYVEGILKNCLAKKVRPSLNKLEVKNGSNRTGDPKRPKPDKPRITQPTAADLAAAAEINRRAGVPAVR